MRPSGTKEVKEVRGPRVRYYMDLKVVFVNSALSRHSLTTFLKIFHIFENHSVAERKVPVDYSSTTWVLNKKNEFKYKHFTPLIVWNKIQNPKLKR